MAEVKMFYEKSIMQDMRKEADFIEGVIAGIGGAFCDKNEYKKSVKPMLDNLRGE